MKWKPTHDVRALCLYVILFALAGWQRLNIAAHVDGIEMLAPVNHELASRVVRVAKQVGGIAKEKSCPRKPSLAENSFRDYSQQSYHYWELY